MPKLTLALAIHGHQPIGNFESVFTDAFETSYDPLLSVVERHAGLRLSLHFTGVLLDWFDRHRPAYLDRIQRLVEARRVELLTGGFYEPIFPVIPDEDKRAQIARLTEWLRARFGITARGMWLAERVWEPSLARPFAEAGVDFVLVDDFHFRAAGLEEDQIFGYYVTEDQGTPLCLVPGQQKLRYLIPFREPEETRDWLQSVADRHPGGFVVMADDAEKFGVWPGTHDWVYTRGWFNRFCRMLEQNAGWLSTAPVGEVVAATPPAGRIYVPATSYFEMMEWALPTPGARAYHHVLERLEHAPEHDATRRFVRGGGWRNFLAKYPESNLMHKKMLRVSRRVCAAEARWGPVAGVVEARRHLLASQCNDAYWHGIFGGLYAPHLRGAVQSELIAAEAALDLLEHGHTRSWIRSEVHDLDCDGAPEISVSTRTLGVLIDPGEGGASPAIDFKPRRINVVNTLARRPEPYHDRVRAVEAGPGGGAGVQTIHDMASALDGHLARFLVYDQTPKHCFLLRLIAADVSQAAYAAGEIHEVAPLATLAYAHELDERPDAILCRLTGAAAVAAGGGVLSARKSIGVRGDGSEIALKVVIENRAQAEIAGQLVLELSLNLMAPDAPDRHLTIGEERHPPAWSGAVGPAPLLTLTDTWQGVRIDLRATPDPMWWAMPIFTVSRSESGFEKVYQGSTFAAVWPLTLPAGGTFETGLRMVLVDI